MKRTNAISDILFLCIFFSPLVFSSIAFAHSIIPPNAYKSFTFGYEQNDGPKDNQYVLSFHPVYYEEKYHSETHGTTDNSRGFLDFLSFKLAHQRDENRLWLERLDLFNIILFFPDQDLGRYGNSVAVYLGVIRRDFASGEVGEAITLHFGEGQSVDLWGVGLAYIMVKADLEANENFDMGYAIGPAVSIGLVLDIFSWLGIGIDGRYTHFLLGENDQEMELTLTGQIDISRSLGVNLDLKQTRLGEREINSAQFRLMFFFDRREIGHPRYRSMENNNVFQ